jgi:hypothetical protein
VLLGRLSGLIVPSLSKWRTPKETATRCNGSGCRLECRPPHRSCGSARRGRTLGDSTQKPFDLVPRYHRREPRHNGVLTSGQHFGGTPLHQIYRCDRAARTSPQNILKGSSGCTRVGMETCLVRLINDYTPTWGSRRVPANHTRHDPGRSVRTRTCHASLLRSAAQMVAIVVRFNVPRKDTRAHNSHQQIIDFSRSRRRLRVEDTYDGCCNFAAPELLCPLPSFLFEFNRE